MHDYVQFHNNKYILVYFKLQDSKTPNSKFFKYILYKCDQIFNNTHSIVITQIYIIT